MASALHRRAARHGDADGDASGDGPARQPRDRSGSGGRDHDGLPVSDPVRLPHGLSSFTTVIVGCSGRTGKRLAALDRCALAPRVVRATERMQTTASSAALRGVPPGPSSWPLLGNLPDMRAAGDMAAYLDRLWRTHGDTFRIKLLGTNAVVIAHPEALKQVLSTRRDRYVKGHIYDSAREFLGNGLVTLEGDAWKARRTLAQPAFHRQSLAKLAAIMARSGARSLDSLCARADG